MPASALGRPSSPENRFPDRDRPDRDRPEQEPQRGALVPSRGGWSAAAERHPMFVDLGQAGTPSASTPFVTQHLDQEWVRRRGAADPGAAADAYRRAASRPARPVQRLIKAA